MSLEKMVKEEMIREYLEAKLTIVEIEAHLLGKRVTSVSIPVEVLRRMLD